MKISMGAAAAALCTVMAGSAIAQTTVNVLRPEPNDEVKKAWWERVIADFEAQHPGVNVEIEYFASEAYKTKLPTMLQSDARPDLIYSWAGGTLLEQAEAGFLQDISGALPQEYRDTILPTALSAFSDGDAIYGLPMYAREIVFWVNTDLTEQAGVDVTTIETWDDFLASVQQIKDAGIVPLVAGGKDKWPLHFYYSYLLLRLGGPEVLPAAMAGEGDGFEAEPFVKAGELLQQLAALEPFQPGLMGTPNDQSNGTFADGGAAMTLMGDWAYLQMRGSSETGGLADEQMAIISFPAVEGGAGAPEETLGGINGYAVTAGAPPETVEFLKHMISAEYQREAGSLNLFIPVVKGADDQIQISFAQEVSQHLLTSPYHQIFLDQFLGASVGGTVNDISVELIDGDITPEDAAARIQEAWDFR